MKYFIDKYARLWEVGPTGSQIIYTDRKNFWQSKTDYPLTEMELDGKNILPKEYEFKEITKAQFDATCELTRDKE